MQARYHLFLCQQGLLKIYNLCKQTSHARQNIRREYLKPGGQGASHPWMYPEESVKSKRKYVKPCGRTGGSQGGGQQEGVRLGEYDHCDGEDVEEDGKGRGCVGGGVAEQ